MSSSNPPAEGVRVEWADVPEKVRLDLEERLGARVVEATTQRGGFSPGLAARVLLGDGSRAFVKAVSEDANPDSHHIYRQEARIVGALPESVPAPRLRWLYDDRGWVALCFDDIDGRHPHEPWTRGDLDLVIRSLKALSAQLTPSPIEVDETASDVFASVLRGWFRANEHGLGHLDRWAVRNLDRLARLEMQAPSVVLGDTLLHFDLRADNMLISGQRLLVFDWPLARTGAAWVDWLAMAPSVEMQGGPPASEFFQSFDVGSVPDASINGALASMAGYFCVHSLDPPPPGIPTVRAFQAAQGAVTLRWLRERTGWD